MARRLLVNDLAPGPVELAPGQAHHARDVLRLREGDEVELFTASGRTAGATLTTVTPEKVIAQVEAVREDGSAEFELTIASAVPKAARADWMIEKLSELGVARFIPLMTDRSIVHPEGRGKLLRWERLAGESAKQSRRAGVMRIEPLTRLIDLLQATGGQTRVAYLSTESLAVSAVSLFNPPCSSLQLLVGPEGGWSPGELEAFGERHLTPISLGATILRVETAAIAAAAVVAALSASRQGAT